MRHYENQLRKSSKRRVSRVELDEESETAVDSIRKVHKHKHRHKNKDIKQIVKNVNEEEISVTGGDENNVTITDPAPCIPADIPRQLTIQVIQPQQENSDSVSNNNNINNNNINNNNINSNNINNNNNNNNNNASARTVSELGLKTIAVIEQLETAPAIEITAHTKHGHVRQH